VRIRGCPAAVSENDSTQKTLALKAGKSWRRKPAGAARSRARRPASTRRRRDNRNRFDLDASREGGRSELARNPVILSSPFRSHGRFLLPQALFRTRGGGGRPEHVVGCSHLVPASFLACSNHLSFQIDRGRRGVHGQSIKQKGKQKGKHKRQHRRRFQRTSRGTEARCSIIRSGIIRAVQSSQ
jgi:hypothetical protein